VYNIRVGYSNLQSNLRAMMPVKCPEGEEIEMTKSNAKRVAPGHTIVSTTSYAKQINDQFDTIASNFVTLQSRLVQTLNLLGTQSILNDAVSNFSSRNKMWKGFSDITLCSAIPAKLNQVMIDTTLQRPLDMDIVRRIVDEFQATMVMPIQVYEDPSKPGKYIAWDGQHTAIALYIIATIVYGELPEDIEIPVNVYPTNSRLEIRRNFIMLNGDAKTPLEFIDIFKQMVFGVRVDGATEKTWKDANEKQKLFEKAGLFATNKKYGDSDRPGAFSLLSDTIMTKDLTKAKPVAVTRMFADYWTELGQNRAVNAKEARQLYEYFNLCHEQKIKVDSAYINEFAQFTKKYFEGDFSENGRFWSKVKLSYTRWYEHANPESYQEHGLKGFTTEMRTGLPFLIAQLNKSTKLKTPSYSPNNGFTVLAKDLWK